MTPELIRDINEQEMKEHEHGKDEWISDVTKPQKIYIYIYAMNGSATSATTLAFPSLTDTGLFSSIIGVININKSETAVIINHSYYRSSLIQFI